MLEEERIATLGGIEDADADGALEHDQNQRDGQNRCAQNHQNRSRVVRPDEQGQTEPGHSRATHAVNGHDEVQAGEDGTEPGDEDAHRGRDHVRIQVVGAERGGEGPAGIDAAVQQGKDQEARAGDVQVPAQQVDLGKGQIFGPNHDGDDEVPNRRRHRGHQEEEDHDHAVHGEELVVSIGGNQIGQGRQQLQTDQAGKGATDKEEERDRDQIQHGDALVIAGEQPALEAVFAIEVAQLWQLSFFLVWKRDNGTHLFTVPGTTGAVLPDLVGPLWPAPSVSWGR